MRQIQGSQHVKIACDIVLWLLFVKHSPHAGNERCLKGVWLPLPLLLERSGYGPLLATQLPLDEAASLETPWKTPAQMKFLPTPYAKSLIQDSGSESDVRRQLGQIQFDLYQPIYEIWADNFKIGELFLESQFVASDYGDRALFFKHQRHVLSDSQASDL